MLDEILYNETKEIKKIVKFNLYGGKAAMTPPLGPTLIQLGINAIAFCREYNEKTKDKIGQNLPIKLLVFIDNTYLIYFLVPTTVNLILDELGIKRDEKRPKNKILYLSETMLNNIYNKKKNEFNVIDKNKVYKTIIGTAKQMGILIEKN